MLNLGVKDFSEAEYYFLATLKAMLKSGAKQAGLDALVGMAHLRQQENQISQALELLALVKHHPSSSWEIREKARNLWEELAAELPPESVAEAEARGRELDLMETAESLLAEGSDS